METLRTKIENKNDFPISVITVGDWGEHIDMTIIPPGDWADISVGAHLHYEIFAEIAVNLKGERI